MTRLLLPPGEPVRLDRVTELSEAVADALAALSVGSPGPVPPVDFDISADAAGSLTLTLTDPEDARARDLARALISDLEGVLPGTAPDGALAYRRMLDAARDLGGLTIQIGDRAARLPAGSEERLPNTRVTGTVQSVDVRRPSWSFVLLTGVGDARVECVAEERAWLPGILEALRTAQFMRVKGEGVFDLLSPFPRRIALTEEPLALHRDDEALRDFHSGRYPLRESAA